ncbi:MAG TPA: class I SAM-dependent methyltransferase [Thermoanaerobaculia bacterium]
MSGTYWNDERARASSFFQWHVYRMAQDVVRNHGIRSVVDVGCGTGIKLVSLIAPFAAVWGIDQLSAIEYCRSNHNVGEFIVADLEQAGFESDLEPGLIVCSDVVEHVMDPDVLLANIRGLCNRDTLILFSTPDRDRLRGADCLTSPHPDHVREWSAAEFTRYLECRGFEVLDAKHLPPVRTAMNALFFQHLRQQWLRRLPYRYNYAVLCRVSAT